MDPVKILPTEVIESIFSYLSLDDLKACCLVSQKWNFAANNETLWKELCIKKGWSDCGKLKKQLNCFKFLNDDSLKHAFNNLGEWRKHFVLKTRIQHNWFNMNSSDHIIHAPKQVDGSDIGNISSVSSDGHNLLAFGYEKGLLSLFDLKNNGCSLLLNKNCPLITSVDYIGIINEYVALIQENLFLIYKLENANLELFRVKLVDTSLVTNLDIETLMEMDQNSRTKLIQGTKEITEDILYHFTESYLVITTFYSHLIYVYNINCDFIEPSVIIDLKEMEIDTVNKFIVQVHNRIDTIYVVLSTCENDFSSYEDRINSSKFSIHAVSIKSKKVLFSKSIANNEYIIELNQCKIESNDRFLVLRFETDFFCVFERVKGDLLISKVGIVFLTANSDPALIALWTKSTSFRITDPTVRRSCHYCLSLDNTPIAMYSDVLVTSCVEFDRDGKGSTQVEFWHIGRNQDEIDVLPFPNNPNVVLIYKDDTKLIFYAERDLVYVRSFLA